MKLIDECELLRAFDTNEMADPISHGKKIRARIYEEVLCEV